MPNWITNIVHIESDDYEEEESSLSSLYKQLKTDESDFDFNAIVKQPWNLEKGNCSGQHKDGEVCWYGWNIQNWGTKWNSEAVSYLMDTYDDDKTVFEILVKFETAWSPPMPVLEKLSENFKVRFTWKDEGSDDWHNWQKI